MPTRFEKKIEEIRNDSYINEINGKARRGEISPNMASKMINDYLLPEDNDFSVRELFARISITEEITENYHILCENYAKKNEISGTLLPETVTYSPDNIPVLTGMGDEYPLGSAVIGSSQAEPL